jgi:hypothetical protein
MAKQAETGGKTVPGQDHNPGLEKLKGNLTNQYIVLLEKLAALTIFSRSKLTILCPN